MRTGVGVGKVSGGSRESLQQWVEHTRSGMRARGVGPSLDTVDALVGVGANIDVGYELGRACESLCAPVRYPMAGERATTVGRNP
jgi:hypothetical protein